jgi:hypothetical protein
VQAISTVTGLQTAIDSKAATTHIHAVATTTTDGFMISADKVKLDGLNSITLLDRANHTGVQAISTVTGLQTALDSKASTAVVTTTANGLMISADKVKLDGLNSITLLDRANHTGVQAISTVTGLQTAIDSKAESTHAHALATTTTDGFFSAADKVKLDSISSGAGSNTISGVTGLQAALDSKASTAVVTTTTNGLMISTDKVKLDGLNSITLLDRANHTGVQAISTVTGLQTALDSKASTAVVTTTANGLMISADKVKLDGLNSITLLDRGNHTGVQAISTVTGLQTAIDSKASTAVVTTTTNGLMVSTDKVKLDGLNSITLLDRANHTGTQAISTVTGLQTAIDSKAATEHNHTLSIGDGTTTKIAVGTNERLDIAAGSNITIAYDDTLNKVTINSSATVTSVASADKWSTPRTIALTGAVTGSASIDGSSNISITTVGPTVTKFYNQNIEPTGVIDGDRWYNDVTGVLLTRLGSVWAEL